MRSGYVDIHQGQLWYTGINGYNWSAIASPERRDGLIALSAYYLAFGAGVYPSHGPFDRWNSFPLRCPITIVHA